MWRLPGWVLPGALGSPRVPPPEPRPLPSHPLINDPLLPHPGQSEPICASQGGLRCPLLQEDLPDFPSRCPWAGRQPFFLCLAKLELVCLFKSKLRARLNPPSASSSHRLRLDGNRGDGSHAGGSRCTGHHLPRDQPTAAGPPHSTAAGPTRGVPRDKAAASGRFAEGCPDPGAGGMGCPS